MSEDEYGDDLDKFLLVVDQLEVCRGLLTDESPARARMALVLLDNLADVLLHRFCQEREGMARRRFYWAAERNHTRRDLRGFHNRLRLVQEIWAVDLRHREGQPAFVDASIAAVLTVGHRYRNAAYHEDEHNPATVALIARMLFTAVTEMWVRECSTRVLLGVYGGDIGPRLGPLAKYELAPRTDDILGRSGIDWAEASTRIAACLRAGFPVQPAIAAGLLADDIARRTHRLRGAIRNDLPSSDPTEVDALIARQEFLDVSDGDPELTRYRIARHEPVRQRLQSGEFPTITQSEAEAVEAAERAFVRRSNELQATFVPSTTTAILNRATTEVRELIRADSEAVLLTRYAAIDEPLERLETYVARASEEWDLAVQAQIDYERGK